MANELDRILLLVVEVLLVEVLEVLLVEVLVLLLVVEVEVVEVEVVEVVEEEVVAATTRLCARALTSAPRGTRSPKARFRRKSCSSCTRTCS